MSRLVDIGFIVALCKGIAGDKQLRRTVLSWLLLAALLMTVAGAAVFSSWLQESPLRFVLYWGICAWFTVTTMLLAAYDLLSIRRDAANERRRIRRETFGEANDQDSRSGR